MECHMEHYPYELTPAYKSIQIDTLYETALVILAHPLINTHTHALFLTRLIFLTRPAIIATHTLLDMSVGLGVTQQQHGGVLPVQPIHRRRQC